MTCPKDHFAMMNRAVRRKNPFLKSAKRPEKQVRLPLTPFRRVAETVRK
jgi:hypothetical protein